MEEECDESKMDFRIPRAIAPLTPVRGAQRPYERHTADTAAVSYNHREIDEPNNAKVLCAVARARGESPTATNHACGTELQL